MKNLGIAVVMFAGLAAFSPSLEGQSAQKPSPYTGVSQPPPDDTITSDAPAAARLVVRPAPAPVAHPTPAPAVASAFPAPPAYAPVYASGASVPPPATARRPRCKSDDRMIGDPDPCSATFAEPANPVATNQAATNPDADIVTSVPTRPGELPEGTILRIALDQEIATGESAAGSDFSGRVSADVVSSGRVVIPQGAQVLGKVTRVTEGRRFGSPATIRLRPDVVVLPDGSRYVLRAQVVEAGGKSRVDSEGTLRPASRAKTNAIKETAGIGTGAVAGALIGGAPGALVGSLIGAGVMTTNILVQHPAAVRVPKDATLTLSLTEPMAITPEVASN